MSLKITQSKIANSNIFNCTDLSAFIASIIQIMPFKGYSTSKFYMCEINGTQFLTKMCLYRKTAPELYGKTNKKTMSHTDAEIATLQLFRRKLIENNITPCILELIHSHVCNSLDAIMPDERVCERMLLDKSNQITPMQDVLQGLCTQKHQLKYGLAHNKCAFLIMEKCDLTMDEYIQKSISTPISFSVFKSLLFLILYTLYAIKCLYPKFRHLDLHTENIVLKLDRRYKFRAADPKFLVFRVKGEVYNIPYFGIIPKIIDFGFSMVPEEGIISNIVEDRMRMFDRSQNDILFLFFWIFVCLSQSDSDKLGRVESLLGELEPNKTYLNFNTEYIRKIEDKIPTYEQMIKNKVFEEYHKYTIQKSQIYMEFNPIENIL